MKNFDFDNVTSKNIFSHPYSYYMASERLQGEEQFDSKNYLFKMPRSHAKIRLKSAQQKLNFLMAKDISKSYKLDCSCMLMPLHVDTLARSRIVTHSNASSFSIKTILCENTNILFSNNY